MFIEIDPKYIKNDDEHLNKRWFRDAKSGCDLLVWQNENGEIVKSQFWKDEALIEWNQGKGLKTGKIDPATGGFKNYQASFYRYHFDFDKKIVKNVKNLINGIMGEGEDQDVFNRVVTELNDIGS